MLRKATRSYYEILDEKKNTTDNRIFWQAVKPMPSNKTINLLNDGDFAKILNNFFSNVITFLGISQVSYEEVLKETNKLDAGKANQEYDITTNVIRKNGGIFAYFIPDSFKIT